MYNTQARVSLALHRANRQCKQRRDNWIIRFAMLCCAVFALDVAIIDYVSRSEGHPNPAHWVYGTTLLPSHAGGYVFVAIIAFVVAVTLTVVCVKYHERGEKR